MRKGGGGGPGQSHSYSGLSNSQRAGSELSSSPASLAGDPISITWNEEKTPAFIIIVYAIVHN